MDDALRHGALRARAEIVSGRLRGEALLALLLEVPPFDRDAWVDALLGIEDLPEDVPDLPRGAVLYLPCGVDEILATLRELRIRPGDHFVDLGSGLGRVSILFHLLSGVRASGIEIQGPLVESARLRCAALGLTGVSFVHANAADLELDGSHFFLYAPFNGELLERVLARLEDVARERPVVVCAVGTELHGVRWLRARRTLSVVVTIYDSSWD